MIITEKSRFLSYVTFEVKMRCVYILHIERGNRNDANRDVLHVVGEIRASRR